MQVTSKRLVENILVLPNAELLFGPDAAQSPLRIVETVKYGDTADIHLTQIGAIAIRFLDGGPLESIEQLDIVGGGVVPDHVTERRDQVVALQGRRLLFANFIAGAISGRIAAIQHTSLSGAISVGMNDILVFERQGDRIRTENTRYAAVVLGAKLAAAREVTQRLRLVPPADLTAAAQFAHTLAARASEFGYANLQTCIAMNYQAAVLHRAQQATASFAINFSVAEALVNEIFYAYGLAGGHPPRAFALRPHSLSPISNNQFRAKSMAQKLSSLKTGGLITSYLEKRLQEARVQRNDLMHGAIPVSVTESGPLQTAVRDLWALLLDEPFELTAAYTMRW